jgi:hypothetical protein
MKLDSRRISISWSYTTVPSWRFGLVLGAALIEFAIAFGQLGTRAQETVQMGQAAGGGTKLTDALAPAEWKRVDEGVAKALDWLAQQQKADGSFPTRDLGEPGITSLCVMAYLSAGHQPGQGKYGETINRGIDYALSCQKDPGVFSNRDPYPMGTAASITRTAVYNHAITGLMLCEAYGQTSRERSVRIKGAIDKALSETARMQHQPPKRDPRDVGGWRYMHVWVTGDSDLSVTAWQLMFLRSAKNAQFEVPNEEKMITAAVEYVERSYQPESGVFFYGLSNERNDHDRYASRAMVGAGVLSLSLAGKHQTEMAHGAGKWILANPFDVYERKNIHYDRFHYGAYYCSNAAAQLGGEYWQNLFPTLAQTLLGAQEPAGSWPAEQGEDQIYGPCYTTALSVLTLTPAYQLLPIYQR